MFQSAMISKADRRFSQDPSNYFGRAVSTVKRDNLPHKSQGNSIKFILKICKLLPLLDSLVEYPIQLIEHRSEND